MCLWPHYCLCRYLSPNDVGFKLIANTHMCLLYGICTVLNSVPLSLDLTVDGPRP